MSLARVERSVRVRRVQAWLFRAPVTRPMVTSFARLGERTVLLVRLTDTEGHTGWGEAYCNFPPHGGEHRMALLESLFVPGLLARPVESPEAAFDAHTRATAVLALQTGETGPIAQCIAAVDIALWDLVARRAGMPLALLLAPTAANHVRAYATGLSPQGLQDALLAEAARGHAAFKLKAGFGRDVDLRAMQVARETVGDSLVAVDANQAWTLPQAIEMAEALAPDAPLWLEEPLPADAPPAAWKALQEACGIDLAAGENLYSQQAFEQMIDAGHVHYVQPDPVKWGGITGVSRVARRARDAGRVFCPHYIGSGLGWMACLHLVSAWGVPGSLVEVDPNENPLRAPLAQPLPVLSRGAFRLPPGAGLGAVPDLAAVSRYQVAAFDVGG
jgi:L-alanine-DL-glutamate epimerase-like enolase superfamily enzyme